MNMHNIVNGFYENVEERRLHMKQELSADIQNEKYCSCNRSKTI